MVPDAVPRALCAVAGLQPTAAGYGFLLALNADAEPYTAVLWDVEYVRLLLSAWEAGKARDVTVPAEKVVGHIREWPWMWVGFAAWLAAAAVPSTVA